MLEITINGERRVLPAPCTVAELVRHLGLERKPVAVEVNEQVIPQRRHAEADLKTGDAVELVTLVGGGSPTEEEITPSEREERGLRGIPGPSLTEPSQSIPANTPVLSSPSDPGVSQRATPPDKPLKVGKFTLQSRLITGTGKYADFELMKQCLDASGCDVTTVAVRRERLVDKQGRNILDYLDHKKLTILPNTAGCFSAEDAIRHARLARELLSNLENPGADWVKLECLGDPKTLLPDPVDTLKATEVLVKEGFQVLVYTTDDPILARRIKNAGAVSVMPAGSPIGSGQGVLNPNNIRIILEYLKEGDPDYPVIIDAGVGTASDVAFAMELGCDGVLLNTAIAHAEDPFRMAWAMRFACDAGRLAYLAGRIPRKLYAQASSPMEGRIAPTRIL